MLIGLVFLVIPPAFVIKHTVESSALKPSLKITAIQTGHTNETGLAKVVALAEAFKATLSAGQQATLQRTYSKGDAVRWSNFPQMAARPSRVGLSIGSLNATQRTALYQHVKKNLITPDGVTQLLICFYKPVTPTGVQN